MMSLPSHVSHSWQSWQDVNLVSGQLHAVSGSKVKVCPRHLKAPSWQMLILFTRPGRTEAQMWSDALVNIT